MAGTVRKRRWAWALATAALASACLHSTAQAQISAVDANPVGGAFDAPLHVSAAPGLPSLMFVVEQDGVVRVIRKGVQLQRPFLDIRSRVTSGGEQGLLSIAFPPDYRKSRRFYVYFNNRACSPTGGCDIEVAEFRRARRTPARALARSHRRVISIPHRDAPNHNGGTAAFGPDGNLWLATGDGGGANDSFDNAWRRSSLLGKLLRIDPRKPRRGRGSYRVPRGNPFVGRRGRDEIWSLGLRNPFRFSFDPQRRAIAIGDVGQGAREEVNFVRLGRARGANFGWPRYEGSLERPDRPLGPGHLVFPVHEYDNPPGAASVIGGVVMRDPRFKGHPDLDPGLGRYVFGDAFTQPLRSFLPPAGDDHQLLPGTAEVQSPAGFGVDRRRRVWVADRTGGRVYRLDPVP